MLALLSTGLRTPTASRRRSLPVTRNPLSRKRSRLCHSPALAMDAGEQFSPPLLSSSPPPPRRKRAFCARCSKPASVCLCSRLRSPPLDNAVGVTILQHNLEGKHALNSARVASLGLRNVAVVPVTDVLFSAEYTVRPLRRRAADAPLGGGGRSGELDLGEISNVAALRGAVPGMVFGTDSLGRGVGDVDDDDDDGDLHLREGLCDRKWSGKVGTLQVPVARGGLKSNGFAANAKDGSEDPHCSENCKSWRLTSKVENGITSSDSTSPKGLIAWPASAEETLDAQFQPKRSELCPYEESSGAEEGNIVVKSALYKAICSSSRLWLSLERTAKPDLSWVLGKPFGKAATSNGFVVRKLQRRQVKGSLELEDLVEFKVAIPPGSALLFPGKSSIALGTVDFEVKHLIVLDGTWDKAKRMYCENPWLQILPHLQLESKAASLYSEVRHQPGPGCFSTIESIVFAMKALGNDMEGLDDLLDVFESMVGDQRRCKDEKFSKMSRS